MSYAWLTVRGGVSNPSSLKFQALMNKQNITENELFKPEQIKPKSISVSTDDTILIQDPFFFTRLKPKTIHYRAPFEPDGNHLKFWFRFNHLGRYLKDEAFNFVKSDVHFDNGAIINGAPKLCKGPDDGVKGGTIVTQLNTAETRDYYILQNPDEHNVGMQEADFNGTGFTICIKFMIIGAPVDDNGFAPRLYFHVDDVNGDYGTQIKVEDNRQLVFVVRRAATSRSFVSPNNAIQSNVWYWAFLTYANNNSMGMRIQNIPQTDSGDDLPSFPDSIENNVVFGMHGDGFAKGKFVGRIADIRYYDFVLNGDHMYNLWNNGRSICAADVVSLDGTNDYIDLGNQPTLWSQSKTKWSASFWTKLNSTANQTLGGSTAWGVTNGSILFWIFNNAIGFGIWQSGEIDAWQESTPLDTKWHHCLATYDSTLGSANLKFYYDSMLGTVTGNATTTTNPNDSMRIGWTSGGLNGNMRDFRFWKTKALTQTEVNLVRLNHSTAPKPDYWLKLNEGTGNPIDAITGTKIGTMTNGANWYLGTSPIPIEFGCLAVAGYTRFNDTVDTGGYDSTGYDSTGYDTT